MNAQQIMLADLEKRAAALGKPLYKIATDAGLSPSTYYRWKGSAKAGFESIQAVVAKLDELEAQGK